MITFREGQNLLNFLWLKFQGKVKTRLKDNQYSKAYQEVQNILLRLPGNGNGFGKPSQVGPAKGAFFQGAEIYILKYRIVSLIKYGQKWLSAYNFGISDV